MLFVTYHFWHFDSHQYVKLTFNVDPTPLKTPTWMIILFLTFWFQIMTNLQVRPVTYLLWHTTSGTLIPIGVPNPSLGCWPFENHSAALSPTCTDPLGFMQMMTLDATPIFQKDREHRDHCISSRYVVFSLVMSSSSQVPRSYGELGSITQIKIIRLVILVSCCRWTDEYRTDESPDWLIKDKRMVVCIDRELGAIIKQRWILLDAPLCI